VTAAAVSPAIAPGPPGLPLLGNLLAFRRDALELALRASRTFGDVVRFRLGPRIVHLVNHPDYVSHVLQHNQKNYLRSARSASTIALVCGDSLLTSTGAAWLRQRRLVQPAFHPGGLPGFVPLMTEATQQMLGRWHEHAGNGLQLGVDREMSRLTLNIVARTMFGAGVSGDGETVGAAMDVLLEGTFRRIGRVVNLPLWVPTPGNRRFRRARGSLDRVVYRMIDERRRQPDGSADLLTRLLRASDNETGSGMNGDQLRDQTITLLLSGHETTANALSWALHLVSTHGEVENRLRAELDSVLGGRNPVADDLPKLLYTSMVLYEAMRLYPPIWILERYAAEDDDIGGYRIPAHSTVVVSPFTLHRHKAFWPSPDEFVPERFADVSVVERQPTAFLPFGAGPHHCVGSHFALLEARVVLAMVVQAFQLRPLPGHVVKPRAEITLRFRNGLQMMAHPIRERAL